MQSHGGATAVTDHSTRPKKPKSREVSSRFLSPTSTASSSSTHDHYGNQSPNTTLSPLRQKPRSSTDSRKHKSFQNTGFFRGLWPSSSAQSLSINTKPDTTLADHLGNDRLQDLEERKTKEKPDQNPLFLHRQRSCTEFSRFENEKRIRNAAKEYQKPVFGGSMRYTGKFKFNSSNLPDDHSDIVHGRFSVDENALRKKSSSRGLSDSETQDSESEYSDVCSGGASFDAPVAGKDSPASYMAPTASSRRHGIEVASKFMHDSTSRSKRWSADSGHNQKPGSSDNHNNSPKIFTVKKGSGNWASSPGPSGSPKDNKGKMMGLTSSKPPTSPSRGKGVGNILSLGIELLRGKKSCSSTASSPLGPGSAENVHQLRLLHNRLMQWRYSNGRADAVNGNIIEQAEIKVLEMWGNTERQHLSAVSNTKDCLHSVVCKIPLVDGAKVEPQLASFAVRHASDLAASINLMLITFTPQVEKTVERLGELAIVVTQEKLLLEECLELFRIISALEIQERSLKSSIMQLKLWQQQHDHQQDVKIFYST
ncbi:QWRF motif-containing protein 3 [Sesamum alatum]|uniref:QWRF motif-containing protein 3 n=1 Tax=Sesamum alatum TaxID=300844 RepID=A0AAE1XYW9_9LAMI|nr:QWRF motif-containing protein 3 [Sesamum alatum]